MQLAKVRLVSDIGFLIVLPLCVMINISPAAAQWNKLAEVIDIGIQPIENIEAGPDQGEGCMPIYRNLANWTGSAMLLVDQHIEAIDDIHSTATGPTELCGFDFGYSSPGATQATVTFYAAEPNPGGFNIDTKPGAVIAGPFLVTDLPAGVISVHVDVANGTLSEPDFWMGVSMPPSPVGFPALLITDPPTVGSSNDTFYGQPGDGYFWFDGDPKANFHMAVEASPPTPSEVATWGSIKAHYR